MTDNHDGGKPASDQTNRLPLQPDSSARSDNQSIPQRREGEPRFLDEPPDAPPKATPKHSANVWDLFADEDDPSSSERIERHLSERREKDSSTS